MKFIAFGFEGRQLADTESIHNHIAFIYRLFSQEALKRFEIDFEEYYYRLF